MGMFASSRHNVGREIQHYDVEKENAECIELYEKMKASGSDEDREAYVLYIINKLHDLIKNHINTMHFDKAAEIDDLVQQARYVILTKVYDYDPHRSMPSSFFSILIDQGLKEATVNASHLNTNYLQLKAKFNNIARDNGFSDVLDPKLTPQKLSKLSGESLTTVKNALELIKISHISLLDVTETAAKNTAFDNPERITLKKDEARFIAKAFQTLSKYEQYLISKLYLEEDKKGKTLSVRSLVKQMSEKESLLNEFGLSRVPTASEVEDAVEKALRKLRHQPGMRERYGRRERHYNRSYTVVEQAPMEVIESAINSKAVAI